MIHKVGNCTLYLGDCLEIMKEFPDESIGACFTDPPYLKKYIYLYEEIAKILKDKLEIGGSFLAITPHYALPEILSKVGDHLKYRWTMSMNQFDGSHPRMAMGIEVVWKPIVWWVKLKWPMKRGFVIDGFINKPVKKEHHKWEQSLSWSDYCMKLVYTDKPVIDPFMGSGTVGISCIRKGIPFIGIEKDEETFNKAVERIEKEYKDV